MKKRINHFPSVHPNVLNIKEEIYVWYLSLLNNMIKTHALLALLSLNI
ncbi:hypothetical protein HMPREF0208_01656 [Citrobacter koseri]|nr:hypothetical protein HMPREF3220_04613 [Citrobacter koseri]KXA02825.1 hypothetical protein HMPREF3207_02113 [Citrobacter koseri]KXB44841.1 hypothetical protein HMPREF0208_01656 [Citrobacter koseri]